MADSRRSARSRRFFAALVSVSLLLLAAAGGAHAHGSIAPTSATAGGQQRFAVTLPRELLSPPVVGFTLRIPPGVKVASAQPPETRWTASIEGDKVQWRGGPSEDVLIDVFAFEATFPDEEGTATFVGRETYETGVGPEFPLPITVIRGATPAVSESDGLEQVAVASAGVALVAAIAALTLVVVLRARLRRRARPGAEGS